MRLLAIVLSLTMLSAPALATEESPVPAPRAVARGQRLMERGRYEEALRLFLVAYDDAPTPRILAQVAIAELSLERWPAAEQHLVKVLNAADDPWVQKNRAPLEQCLATASAHLGKLVLAGAPPLEAKLLINGEDTGPVPPTPLTVAAGRTVVEVRADGYEPFTATVDVAGSSLVTLSFALRPIRRSPIVIVTPPPPPRAPERPAWPKILGGTLAVAGVAGIATGVVLLTKDGHCAQPPATGTCAHLWNTKALGVGVTIGGAVAVAAGTIVLWRAFSRSPTSLQMSWSNGPVLGASSPF